MIDPKKAQRLAKVLTPDGTGIASELDAIEEKVDKVKETTDQLEADLTVVSEAQNSLISEVKQQSSDIKEKLSKSDFERFKPKDGKDGKTIIGPKGDKGEDGKSVDEIAVVKHIKQNLSDFGNVFRDGLELLKDDARLDKKAIKGLEDYDETYQMARRPFNSGGGLARGVADKLYAPIGSTGTTVTNADGTITVTGSDVKLANPQPAAQTKITNLNADLLDGYHASSFLPDTAFKTGRPTRAVPMTPRKRYLSQTQTVASMGVTSIATAAWTDNTDSAYVKIGMGSVKCVFTNPNTNATTIADINLATDPDPIATPSPFLNQGQAVCANVFIPDVTHLTGLRLYFVNGAVTNTLLINKAATAGYLHGLKNGWNFIRIPVTTILNTSRYDEMSSFTDWQILIQGDGSAVPITFYLSGIWFEEAPIASLCLGFDGSYQETSNAFASMDARGYRGVLYHDNQAVGTDDVNYLTEAQVAARYALGWDSSIHGYEPGGPGSGTGGLSLAADTTTNVITSANHGLNDGDLVRFNVTAGGLTVLTDYYIISATTSTFKVSTAVGGSEVDITTTLSGTKCFPFKHVLMDCINAQLWNASRGYHRGNNYRCWLQNSTPCGFDARPELRNLFDFFHYAHSSSPFQTLSPSCWPPEDRFNVNRMGLHRTPGIGFEDVDGTTASLKTYFDFLIANKLTAFAYTHKVLPDNDVACTISVASPAVVSCVGHGYTANEAILFRTDGTLPTGVTAGTVYYVSATGLTNDSFQFSATAGGPSINTSGSADTGTTMLWDASNLSSIRQGLWDEMLVYVDAAVAAGTLRVVTPSDLWEEHFADINPFKGEETAYAPAVTGAYERVFDEDNRFETPPETPDGVITLFTVMDKPKCVVADGATYFEGAGYTYANFSITMDVPPSVSIKYLI